MPDPIAQLFNDAEIDAKPSAGSTSSVLAADATGKLCATVAVTHTRHAAHNPGTYAPMPAVSKLQTSVRGSSTGHGLRCAKPLPLSVHPTTPPPQHPPTEAPPPLEWPIRHIIPHPTLPSPPTWLSVSPNGCFALVSGTQNGYTSYLWLLDLTSARPPLASATTDTATSTPRGQHEVCDVAVVDADVLGDHEGLDLLHVAWHPHSNLHFGLLTSDNTWRLYNVQDVSMAVRVDSKNLWGDVWSDTGLTLVRFPNRNKPLSCDWNAGAALGCWRVAAHRTGLCPLHSGTGLDGAPLTVFDSFDGF